MLGVRPVMISVPAPVMSGVGKLGDALSARLPFPLDSARIDALFSSLTLDISAIMSDCDYRPRYTLHDGIQETAAWFNNRRSGRTDAL